MQKWSGVAGFPSPCPLPIPLNGRRFNWMGRGIEGEGSFGGETCATGLICMAVAFHGLLGLRSRAAFGQTERPLDAAQEMLLVGQTGFLRVTALEAGRSVVVPNVFPVPERRIEDAA